MTAFLPSNVPLPYLPWPFSNLEMRRAPELFLPSSSQATCGSRLSCRQQQWPCAGSLFLHLLPSWWGAPRQGRGDPSAAAWLWAPAEVALSSPTPKSVGDSEGKGKNSRGGKVLLSIERKGGRTYLLRRLKQVPICCSHSMVQKLDAATALHLHWICPCHLLICL